MRGTEPAKLYWGWGWKGMKRERGRCISEKSLLDPDEGRKEATQPNWTVIGFLQL